MNKEGRGEKEMHEMSFKISSNQLQLPRKKMLSANQTFASKIEVNT